MSNNPTTKQRRMWSKVAAIGCMACLQDGIYTPCSIHHLKEYGYRNHDKVFGLCPTHHQHEFTVPGIPNRHKTPIEFTERYGTDQELFEKCMAIIQGEL